MTKDISSLCSQHNLQEKSLQIFDVDQESPSQQKQSFPRCAESNMQKSEQEVPKDS